MTSSATCVFICFERGEGWAELDMRWTISLEETSAVSAVVWEGKVYYMYSGRVLVIIDPLPSNLTIQFLEMYESQLLELTQRCINNVVHRSLIERSC